MKFNWIDRLGDGNAQLFRELKGRLTIGKFSIAISSSLIGQILLVILCSNPNCLYENGSCVQFIWSPEWRNVYNFLNWILPLLLLGNGVYALINDVGKEERQGTLNFIRFSPQSSQSILIGKMLGVPVLIYLAVALAMPLHLGSGLAAGWPFFWILGTYTLWGIGCYLFYSVALLYTVHQARKFEVRTLAWGGGLLAYLLGTVYNSLLHFSFDWYKLKTSNCLIPGAKEEDVINYNMTVCQSSGGDWQWFFLPIGRHPEMGYIWLFMTVAIAGYWYWQSVNRRFHFPQATMISKQQSYWLVGSVQIWLLGFGLPQLKPILSESDLTTSIGVLLFLTPVFFLILIASLSPSRQALLDWARYETVKPRKKSVFSSNWLWGEKSPILVAIAVNLLIVSLFWLPWMLLWPQAAGNDFLPNQVQLLLGWVLTVNVILIYAAIAALIQLSKIPKWIYFIYSVFAIIFLSFLSAWQTMKNQLALAQFLLLFSPFPGVILGFNPASLLPISLGLIAQIVVMTLLGLQLKRQIQKAGESATKAALAGHRD